MLLLLLPTVLLLLLPTVVLLVLPTVLLLLLLPTVLLLLPTVLLLLLLLPTVVLLVVLMLMLLLALLCCAAAMVCRWWWWWWYRWCGRANCIRVARCQPTQALMLTESFVVLLAVGETVIMPHPPSTYSRCFNRDGEGTSANSQSRRRLQVLLEAPCLLPPADVPFSYGAASPRRRCRPAAPPSLH